MAHERRAQGPPSHETVAREGGRGGASESEAGLEGRLKRIEEIVAALDSDSLGLDQALALFEEGVEHVRRARAILSAAELKVEELIGARGEETRRIRPGGEEDGALGDNHESGPVPTVHASRERGAPRGPGGNA